MIQPETQISFPGSLLLPECRIDLFDMSVHRDADGQIQELVLRFDPNPDLQAKLKSRKLVPLQFRDTEEQVEFDVSDEFCNWPSLNRSLGYQHLHLSPLDQKQIETIERFLQTVDKPAQSPLQS